MKKIVILYLIFMTGIVYSGNVTVSLVGVNPITINIKGVSQNEEAGSITIYLYYCDDGVTSLNVSNVDATKIEDDFGWGTDYVTKEIHIGSYLKGGHTFTRELLYANADISSDDYWTTGGVNAIVCTFTSVGSGHAYVEVDDPDGLADWSGIAHIVSYGNRDQSLPVQMARFSAETSKEFGVVIHWYTESELNTVGFDIYRSEADQKSYLKINPALIPGQGNSSSGNEYSFSDRNIQEGVIYWYKIMEIAQNGTQQEYGPIKVEGVNTIPDEFSLSYSYPNPFNPVTNFKYQLAEDAKVTINVYNLLGERIKQLVNENKPAGYYTETWEGVNENNQRVSSGIYLIYMQAGSFSMTRKITLIR